MRQNLREPLVERDVNNQIVRERNDEMRKLGDDLSDLQDIMSEVTVLLDEQGEVLIDVEQNVDAADDFVDTGNKNLKDALELQNDYRKCVCLILVIVVIAVTVASVIIVLSVCTPENPCFADGNGTGVGHGRYPWWPWY
eukprot:TRINITY_DN11180_c0_g1_i1.p1 TRINITY_DN11180_c0_g1~~TRINITY_DN11180_c0_g1_i1.p1  ORF type:complete len:139 (+),score=34.37 TRINITY_DN11180_c0_g1_i1:128-544(+)